MKTIESIVRNQTVVITGASSGIGKATAFYLARKGMKVFAGVRKEADRQDHLKASTGNLVPVILDVCNQQTIDTAFKLIARESRDSMISLVNNAGLSLNGPLEILPMEDIESLINVNLLGLLAVTKTFIPLIRKNQGRLINISSGHGLLAIPDKSVYAASKFGVQAITDSLRLELRPFGVKVSSVVVGKVNTGVLGKILDDRKKMIDQAPPEILGLYSQLIEYFDKEVKNIPGIEPVEVSKIIHNALTEARPKHQYLVGPGAKKMKVLSRFPVRMRDNMLFNAIHK